MIPLPLLLLAAGPAPPNPLTLEGVLERARSAAPEVVLAAQLVGEAEASRVGQGLILPTNPRLFGEYRPITREQAGQPSDPRHGYQVGLDGLLEVSGAAGLRVNEAERRVEVAGAELAVTRSRAVARAWITFLEIKLAEERARTADAALEIAQRVLDASRERVAAGVSGEPELTTAAVERATVAAERVEADRLRTRAELELRQLLDWGASEPLVLADLALALREVEDAETLARRALAQRPELAALRARIALLETSDERLTREAIPKLGYNVGLDAAPASPVFAFFGLAIELPVAQRNQGPRAVTAAQLATERTRVEVELRRIALELGAARSSFEARRKQLALLTGDALPQARRNEALVEEGWRAGRFDVFRLTTASRELLRLERERVELLLAAWTDYVELQRVSGGLDR